MKRFFLAAACLAAMAICSSSASAQGPVKGIVTGDCGKPGGCAPAAAVSDTVFSRLAWWKSSSCSTCGTGSSCRSLKSITNNASGMPTGKPAAFVPYPQGTPGTLVFPQHPFVRSPRDFFMVDPK